MSSRRPGRLIAVVAALVVALTGSMAAPSFAGRDDELKDKRHDITRELESASSELNESSAELVAATHALARAGTKLVDARRHLGDTRTQLNVAIEIDQQMQSQLVEAEARLAAAEVALADGQQDVSDAKDALATFVVNSYQYGNPSLMSLGVVLDGGSTTDFSERLSLAGSVAGAQLVTVDDLRAAVELLRIREQQVAEVRDEVALHRADAAVTLEREQELEAVAAEQASAVRTLVEDRRKAQARATRAQEADLHQIALLERERARIEGMLQRIAQREPPRNRSVADEGGWLSLPIADAYITSPFGMRMHPILHVVKLHDGTDFGANCGAPVYAAASGTVVSEYVDSAYGDRIIVSHGRVNGISLATSYNHLSGFVARNGEVVKRGQLIGFAGTTGYSTGCHLHFMVYENGVAVNPVRWL